MRRISVVAAALAVFAALALPAGAVVDEIVAAYCSGGDRGAINAEGLLGPPGLSDMSKRSFAAPVLHNGTFSDGAGGSTFPLIGKGKAVKYPELTNIFTLDPATEANHPSALHCKALK